MTGDHVCTASSDSLNIRLKKRRGSLGTLNESVFPYWKLGRFSPADAKLKFILASIQREVFVITNVEVLLYFSIIAFLAFENPVQSQLQFKSEVILAFHWILGIFNVGYVENVANSSK